MKTCHPFLALLLLAALLPSPAAAKEIRPNIQLILSDDHAKGALSCYGNTDIQTPALDRLAAEGMRFEHALTPNSFCTPSRAAVLTGKYSHKNGVTHLNRSFDGSQPTFPRLLQKTGYETSLFGKWHLLSQPTGFDHYCVQKMQGKPFDPIVFEPEHEWIPWQLFDLKNDPPLQKMKYRTIVAPALVCRLLSVSLVFSLAWSASGADRPNILLILVGDMGWKDISCSGSTYYQTPHIDQLATEGQRMVNAYSAAPTCSPSRGALLTGKFSARTQFTAVYGGTAGPDDRLHDTSKYRGEKDQTFEARHRHAFVRNLKTTKARAERERRIFE